MATNPVYRLSQQFVDYSGEKSNFTVHVAPIDDTNINSAIGWTGAPYAALRTAAIGLTLAFMGDRTVSVITKGTNASASDANSQREIKFLVQYEDQVNFRLYNAELPCANLAAAQTNGWFKPNTDELDLTATEVAAFVSAFNAAAVSPDGNPVNVRNIRLVGRNI
jgi:hypothetical protein